jgi:hypothetical protein
VNSSLIVVALVGIFGASCSLNLNGKNACVTNVDCSNGWTCVNRQCRLAQGSAQDAGSDPHDASADHHDASSDQPSGATHGDSSTDAAGSGSLPPSQGTCDAGPVTECPGPPPNGQCQQVYCGGRLWRDSLQALTGYIPYRIHDPNGLFSDAYKSAIRDSASAWTKATGGLITFAECSNCTGRFISVVPGPGDGVDESADWEQLLPLPIDSAAPDVIPWHRIAHQWGHAIGLDDMYRRPDRDRYTSFDPAVWCRNGASLPATCASSGPAQQPGSPPIASGTFGPYDELSVMNGVPSDGVCDGATAEPDSAQPTMGDASAVTELYLGAAGPWSPFQPIARSVAPDEPLDYQLAPGVDPVGGPAIAEWTAPSVDIAVRGSDGNVYETWNDLLGTTFLDWAEWKVIADHVDADPALVFGGEDALYLVVRSAVDGSIRLRTRTTGVWGRWGSLGAPPEGAASAPTIIVPPDGQSLSVFVRSADDLIYQLDCQDPATMCAASAAAANAWTPLPAPTVGGFVGKPAATWLADGGPIVSAIGADDTAWIIAPTSDPYDWGTWVQGPLSVSSQDPDPSVALASSGGFSDLDLLVRDPNGFVLQAVLGGGQAELGGMPLAALGAVGTARGDVRTDIVALINDHGRPGVWWKFLSPQYTPPCNYNAPGTCAQCGCGFAGAPRCDL